MGRFGTKFGITGLLGCFCLLAAERVDAQSFEVRTGNAAHLGSRWAEITSAAIGPNEHPSCPKGRLFFADSASILATELDGTLVSWPDPSVDPNPRAFGFGDETFWPHVIHDNHLVKLKDGSLVHTVEAVTWNDNIHPHPAWWQSTEDFHLKDHERPGGRGIIYVFRSDDCGRTWARATDIDAATLEVKAPSGEVVKGLCATPRLVEKVGSVLTDVPPFGKINVPTLERSSEAGGWDGHYLYADPYNGNLFLSTPCVYGLGLNQGDKWLALLLLSTNRGESWDVIGQMDAATEAFQGWRMPITSLASGTVAFGYKNWQEKTFKLATFNPPYSQVSLAPATTLAVRSPNDLSPGTTFHAIQWESPTLTRNLNKGFLATVADWNQGDNGLNIVHRVISVPSAGGTPVELAKVETTKSRDMFHGAFISGPPDSNLHVLYWVERIPGLKKANGTFLVNSFQVKFQVFSGTNALLKQPGTLTVARGKAYTFLPGADMDHGFIGDYMSGASYKGPRGSVHFVAAWSEDGALRFNTISVSKSFFSFGKGVSGQLKVVSQ